MADVLNGDGLTRRRLLLGGATLLIGGSGIALAARRTVQVPAEVNLISAIPSTIGPWRATADDSQNVNPLERGPKQQYDQEVSRIYSAGEGGLPFVMLVLAYGSTQSDNLQVHRPEFCYPASGFELGPRQPLSAELAGRSTPMVFFTAVREQRVEHVLYWTRLGQDFPTSWLGQHRVRMVQAIRGVVPDGVLVRASVIGGDAAEARGLLAGFLDMMVRGVQPEARQALLG
jgi:EpsI family protein